MDPRAFEWQQLAERVARQTGETPAQAAERLGNLHCPFSKELLFFSDSRHMLKLILVPRKPSLRRWIPEGSLVGVRIVLATRAHRHYQLSLGDSRLDDYFKNLTSSQNETRFPFALFMETLKNGSLRNGHLHYLRNGHVMAPNRNGQPHRRKKKRRVATKRRSKRCFTAIAHGQR